FWLTSTHGIYYLQRFIDCEGDGFSDWRVFVINGQSLAAMRRGGISWLNNVARGAICEAAELDSDLCNLAERAVGALHMHYGGVDIIRDKEGGYSVIEVNSVPAWKGLQSVCHVDIADRLAADFLARCTSAAGGGGAASCA
ncbi:MAG: alpha-L-glutamate ligase, partial [Pseudomonadota bacterium]